MLGYLALLPGLIVLDGSMGGVDESVVYAFGAIAFGGLLLALVAARIRDHTDAADVGGWAAVRTNEDRGVDR